MAWWKRLLNWVFGGKAGRAPAPQGDIMSESYDAQPLLEVVKQALRDMEWRFAEDPDRPSLMMYSRSSNALYSLLLQVNPEHPLITLYAHVQCAVPPEKRVAIAEFLTRANYGLWLGNFELDFRDGEVRYKTSIDLADGTLTTEMLRNLLRANLSTIDRYLPGVMSVLWNDVTPEDAIALVER